MMKRFIALSYGAFDEFISAITEVRIHENRQISFKILSLL